MHSHRVHRTISPNQQSTFERLALWTRPHPLQRFSLPTTSQAHRTVLLRKIGALDETTSTPKVLIANYITGPSNCIASSSYYSVCCLNNCDAIMDEIEHKVLAPATSPERLIDIVRNISHGQALPRGLPEKLQKIAERHA